MGRKRMGHGVTLAAAFGSQRVALNELSQEEYQELITMLMASFIIKTLIQAHARYIKIQT